MAYHPTLTSYQIPFQPLIQTTRQQIQRSLSTLQQKLRRRRQIDIQTQLQIQSQLSKTASLPFHQTYYQALREMEERDRVYHNIAQDQIYRQQAINDFNHLNRIQELKFERDQLVKETLLARTYAAQKALPLKVLENVSASDQQLIRKYQNGSKAIQYYKDLQKQEKKGNHIQQISQQPIRNKVEPQKQLFQTLKKDPGILGLQSAKQKVNTPTVNTPYEYIKYPIQEKKDKSPQKSHQKSKLAKELEKQFNQLQRNQQKKHVQSILRMPGQISNKRAISPVKFLNDQSPHNQSMKRYKSLGRMMPCNRSRSNLSPHHGSIINQSYLHSKSIKAEPKLSVKQIELQAIKKIQNRLKVSKVIYEDSQFRNIKYEGNHLFNKFEMQMKQRNQIKDKVNSHPLVLRKHALVVQ